MKEDQGDELGSSERSKQYLTATQVRARLGNISDMTLWRWLRSEEMGFPQPIIIASRRYFDEAEISAWQRKRQAKPAHAA